MGRIRSLTSDMRAKAMTLARGKLARLFAGTFAMAVFNRGIGLLMMVVLARYVGPKDFGNFNFALSTAMFLGQIVGLGLPMLANKTIPELMVHERWDELKGFNRGCDMLSVGAGIATGLVLFVVSRLSFVRSEIATGLWLAAILIIPITLRLLRRRQLGSIGRPAIGLFIDEGFAPACLVISLLLFGSLGLIGDITIMAATTMAGVLFGGYLLGRGFPGATRKGTGNDRTAMWGWLMAAVPMMVGMASRQALNRTDVLLLAPLSTMTEVGYFGAAMRLAFAVTFPQVILNTVVAPTLSGPLAEGKIGLVKRRFYGSLAFSVVTSVPVAILMWLFRYPIMQISFGDEFVSASDVLAYLVFGQTAIGIGLPCSALLMMSGRERIFAAMSLTTLAVNVIAGFMLIPSMGSVGAAVAMLIGSCVLVCGQVYFSVRTIRQLERLLTSRDGSSDLVPSGRHA